MVTVSLSTGDQLREKRLIADTLHKVSVEARTSVRRRGLATPTPPGVNHSYLSARIGSILLARLAGIRPAAADTTASSAIVATAIHGSFG